MKIKKNNFYSLKNYFYCMQKIKSFISLKISMLARLDIYVKNINERFIIELKKKVIFLYMSFLKN